MGPIALVIAVVLVAVALVAAVAMYNGLVRRRLRVDVSWAQVDVQLKRRHDLVPNLVNAVKGYMGFEQTVLERVTQARARAIAAGGQGLAARVTAENQLSQTLRSVFAVVEHYPDLKASQNVLALQAQVTTTEDQLSASRDAYNAAVRAYNTAIATFPAALMAGPMGFERREFFAAEPGAANVPSVELGER